MSMVTHISKNLPINLLINFPGFTETRNVKAMDAVLTAYIYRYKGHKG